MAGVQAVPELLFSPSLSIDGLIRHGNVRAGTAAADPQWEWPAAGGTEKGGTPLMALPELRLNFSCFSTTPDVPPRA